MIVRKINDPLPTRSFRLSEQLMMPWHPKANISTVEAAKLLGCTKPTVLELIEEGTLEAYKLRPHKRTSPWKISMRSLQAFASTLSAQTGRPERQVSVSLN